MSVSYFSFAAQVVGFPKLNLLSCAFFSASGSFNHPEKSRGLSFPVSQILCLVSFPMH